MLLKAARDLDLDLGASYTVGDKISDIIAGQSFHRALIRRGQC